MQTVPGTDVGVASAGFAASVRGTEAVEGGSILDKRSVLTAGMTASIITILLPALAMETFG